ncbi:MAG TPA: hypothetical protein VE553_05570 [Candidatus Binatia bacterium]|nr:hypothetical protein [Candidatus Binatia bacterium]
MTTDKHAHSRIAVVGPCVSGKSELVGALREAGFEARHVAQEHSYVPEMWQRISRPDVLIYLDVDYATAKARRPYIDWGPERLREQAQRLAHARSHCQLYIDTSSISRQEVREKVFEFLEGLEPSSK